MNGFTRRTGPGIWARCLLTLATLLVAVAAQVGAAGPAAAHTVLVGCSPHDGATMAEAPKSVSLTFTEPVRTEFVEVGVRVDGTAVPGVRPEVAGPVVRVDTAGVAPAAQPRAWEVSYRVVSADGHPVRGTLRFHTDPAAAATATADSGRCSSGGGSSLGTSAAVAGGLLLVLGVALAVIRRRVLAP